MKKIEPFLVTDREISRMCGQGSCSSSIVEPNIINEKCASIIPSRLILPRYMTYAFQSPSKPPTSTPYPHLSSYTS